MHSERVRREIVVKALDAAGVRKRTNPVDWGAVEERASCTLPPAYKELIDQYAPFMVAQIFTVLDPKGADPETDLFIRNARFAEIKEDMHNSLVGPDGEDLHHFMWFKTDPTSRFFVWATTNESESIAFPIIDGVAQDRCFLCSVDGEHFFDTGQTMYWLLAWIEAKQSYPVWWGITKDIQAHPPFESWNGFSLHADPDGAGD